MRYPNFQLCSSVVFSTGKQTAAVWQEAARRLDSREATSLCGAATLAARPPRKRKLSRKTFGP